MAVSGPIGGRMAPGPKKKTTEYMTLEKAQQKLAALRGQQRALRQKIDALRAFLCTNGADPDAPAVDLTERNNRMYNRYLDGLTWEEIAGEFRLSKERVKQVCRRVERANERKAGREGEEA